MSSPEFAELRAISGTAVAKRCALLLSPAKRQLLWFIQGVSIAEGGLSGFVRELLRMFPERVIPVARYQLGGQDHFDFREKLSREDCVKFALGEWPGHYVPPEKRKWDYCPQEQSLEEFLIDLCINPRLRIGLVQAEIETSEFDEDLVLLC
jgi:hypothetical protein